MYQSEETSTLTDRARKLAETATPYQIASTYASQSIHALGIHWSVAIQPWNDSRAVTVVDGHARHTRESHELGQTRARKILAQLIAALKSPEDADVELFRLYPGMATAIFALNEADRFRVAEEYQARLDAHPA